MSVYMYQAALWCDDCGRSIVDRLTAEGKAPADPSDECSFDSDDFPKNCEGLSDESDSVEVCECGEFLDNALTSEGGKRLCEMAEETLSRGPEYINAEFWRGVLERYSDVLETVTLADLVRARLESLPSAARR